MTNRWVVDTGPLSHFAQAGWLGVLRMLAPCNRIIIPDCVDREIRTGAATRPWLAQVVSLDWIECQPLETEGEVQAYARYARLLVGDDGRNTGECGVLALAEVYGHTAIVDDGAACKAARRNNIEIMRTLKLLFDAINQGKLTTSSVSAIADDLLATEYRIPVQQGRAIQWGIEKGLIDAE